MEKLLYETTQKNIQSKRQDNCQIVHVTQILQSDKTVHVSINSDFEEAFPEHFRPIPNYINQFKQTLRTMHL